MLCAGGTLVLQGNVSYDAEAVSDAAFLHTLVQTVEQGQEGFPQPAHPTEPTEEPTEEPAKGRVDLDRPGPHSVPEQ